MKDPTPLERALDSISKLKDSLSKLNSADEPHLIDMDAVVEASVQADGGCRVSDKVTVFSISPDEAEQVHTAPSATDVGFWLLQPMGGGKPHFFTGKHIALESLELTYPDAVANQGFNVRWGVTDEMAQIAIDHVGMFFLVRCNLLDKAKVLNLHF